VKIFDVEMIRTYTYKCTALEVFSFGYLVLLLGTKVAHAKQVDIFFFFSNCGTGHIHI
jgi:hypothetical protein